MLIDVCKRKKIIDNDGTYCSYEYMEPLFDFESDLFFGGEIRNNTPCAFLSSAFLSSLASLFGAPIREQPRFYLHQPNHQTTNNQQSINNILPAPSILLNQSS